MLVIEPSTQFNFSPISRRYTLAEFSDLPEPDEHSKLELIGGILYMTPMPDWEHAKVVEMILKKLMALKAPGKIFVPRAGITTGENTWIEPDLFYISETGLKKLTGHPTTADLVVEVLSQGTEEYDRTTKSDTYAALGVGELWLVDYRKKTIEARVNPPGGKAFTSIVVYETGDELISQAIPDLKFKIDDVFSK